MSSKNKGNKSTGASKAETKNSADSKTDKAKAAKRAKDIEAAKAKNPAELTLTELRLLVSAKKAETAGADAVERGQAKLSKLRTYAIRQRAWADAATAKAVKANDKAEDAEISLKKYEGKLGVEPMDQAAIDATLAELQSTGRIAQVTSDETHELEPQDDAKAADATKVA